MTSTNDMVSILQLAKNLNLSSSKDKKLSEFNSALFNVFKPSKRVAADGEGASKFVTIA